MPRLAMRMLLNWSLFVNTAYFVNVSGYFTSVVNHSPKHFAALNFNELVGSEIDIKKQIFCNVELNCNTIEAVGFDMDYTLIQVRYIYCDNSPPLLRFVAINSIKKSSICLLLKEQRENYTKT